jgi:hypothetical protein
VRCGFPIAICEKTSKLFSTSQTSGCAGCLIHPFEFLTNGDARRILA